MNEERRKLAQGIRAALARMNGNQNERAAAIGCSPTSLARWSTGAAEPRPQYVDRIARLSGLTQEAIRNGGKEAA